MLQIEESNIPFSKFKSNIMKHRIIYLIVLIIVFYTMNGLTQVPGNFNYQAVLRDASGKIMANVNTTIVISIHLGSPSGVEVFSE